MGHQYAGEVTHSITIQKSGPINGPINSYMTSVMYGLQNVKQKCEKQLMQQQFLNIQIIQDCVVKQVPLRAMCLELTNANDA